MAIRVTRNETGNCINFVGSTQPAYWNACLSAQANSGNPDNIDIVNDIISDVQADTVYEFFNVPFTEFADKDGNVFADVQAAIDYINANANVTGLSTEVGKDMTGVDINFRLDETSTTVLLDNGFAFAVNSIKAVADTDGTVHIHAISTGTPEDGTETDRKHLEKVEVGRVYINGNMVAGGLQTVVNTLNELFTVGPFEAVVITDPAATVIADVNGVDTSYTLEGNTAVDPAGDAIFTNSSSGNYAGLKTVEAIDQAGEYFTFDIQNEGQIGFGLIHTDDSYSGGFYTGTAAYADPATFAVGNSAHYGYQFSHWFHPTPNGSWTNYGASTGFVRGGGWYSWESQDEWLAGDAVKVKVGIDENGFIAIYTLQDNDTDWILHARTSYPVAEGASFHLGIKCQNATPRVLTTPKVHLRAAEVTAPTTLGDQSITVFEDTTGDITGTLAGGIAATVDDSNQNDGFVTTETISAIGEYFQFEWSAGDANVGLFSHQDHAVADLQADRSDWGNEDYIFFGARTENNGELNSVYYEAGGHTSLASSGGAYYGRVGFDADGRATLWYSSDGTNWTIYRRSNQSAPVGTYSFIFVAQDSGANMDSLTKGTMTFAPTMTFRFIESPDGNFEYPLFATEEEANYYDQQNGGSGTSHTHTYSDDPTNTTWYMPDTNGVMDGTSAPVADGSLGTMAMYTEITSLTNADQTPPAFTGSDFTYEEGTAVNIPLQPADTTYTTSVVISPAGSGLVFNSTTKMLQGTLTDVGADTTYTITVTRANSYGSSVGSFDITATDVAPVSTSATSFDKALDFSGSSERAQSVSSSVSQQPIAQYYPGTVTSGTDGYTSSNSNANPWATACVFKIDGNYSNQHIWNQGEGAGSTDDNIYLRVDANQNLYFGWGRDGSLNECRIMTAITSGQWYGVYIAHDGRRYAAAGSTPGNLYKFFDIRVMSSHDGFASSQDKGTYNDWNQASSTTGGRMDRSIAGDFTIGGRGSNRNFHGKVASFVSTTLKQGVAMPTQAEAELMITDPMKWAQDYKVGETYRAPYSSQVRTGWNFTNSSGGTYPSWSTQIWLMGDGPNDSYSNMIRNQVNPGDQNYTKLNLLSMVSNDIENVTINGLG